MLFRSACASGACAPQQERPAHRDEEWPPLATTKEQRDMNNTIIEMKNTLEGISNRITEAEERISDLEDKIVEIITTEQNKEKD